MPLLQAGFFTVGCNWLKVKKLWVENISQVVNIQITAECQHQAGSRIIGKKYFIHSYQRIIYAWSNRNAVSSESHISNLLETFQ